MYLVSCPSTVNAQSTTRSWLAFAAEVLEARVEAVECAAGDGGVLLGEEVNFGLVLALRREKAGERGEFDRRFPYPNRRRKPDGQCQRQARNLDALTKKPFPG